MKNLNSMVNGLLIHKDLSELLILIYNMITLILIKN